MTKFPETKKPSKGKTEYSQTLRQANLNLAKIHFHTFRHWKATTEQHKTKDPWHVKMILGHKSITFTENYIHLEEMRYNGDANDQFTVKVADTMEDAIKLMEVGFEFHAEIEGHKLFRKRKGYIMDNLKSYGMISQPLYLR